MDLKQYDLDPQTLIAGFGGGVAHAFAFRQTQAWAVVSSVVLGTLAANFLTPMVHDLYPGLNIGGVAFLIGLGAMAFIQGFVGLVTARLAKLAGEKTGGGKP